MIDNLTVTAQEYADGLAFGATSVDAFPTSPARAGTLCHLALRTIAWAHEHRELMVLAFAIGVRDGIEAAADRHFEGDIRHQYGAWQHAAASALPTEWQSREALLASLPVPADLTHGEEEVQA